MTDVGVIAKGSVELSAGTKSLTGGISSALSSLGGPLGEVGKLGSEAASQIGAAFESQKNRIGAVAGAISGIAGGLLGLGSKAKASEQEVAQAFTNANIPIDDGQKIIEKAVKTNEKFGDGAETTQHTLSRMAEAGVPVNDMLAKMDQATGIAQAKHESLSTAVEGVIKGGARLAKQFGITTDQIHQYEQAHGTATTATSGAAAAVDKQIEALKAQLLGLTGSTHALSDQKAMLGMSAAAHVTLISTVGLTGQALIDVEAKNAATTASHKAAGDQLKLTGLALGDNKLKIEDQLKALEAQKKSLGDAAKASNGDQTALDNQTISTLVAAKTHGLAAAAADTVTGKLKALGTQVLDGVSKWAAHNQALLGMLTAGGAVVPALTKVGGGIASLIGKLPLFSAATDAAAASETAAGGAGDVMGAGMTVALGPIGLIILAIAAVVAAAYLIYRNWSTISDFFKGLWKDVSKLFDGFVDFIKTWGLRILEFITGTFLLVEVVKHWTEISDAIVKACTAALDFIASIPAKILGLLGDGAQLLSKWGGDIIGGLVQGIKDGISGLGHILADIGSTVWNGIKKGLGPLGNFLSPKTEAGVMVGQGLGLGIIHSLATIGPDVTAAAAKLGAGMMGPLAGGAMGAMAGVGTTGGAAGGGGGATIIHIGGNLVTENQMYEAARVHAKKYDTRAGGGR